MKSKLGVYLVSLAGIDMAGYLAVAQPRLVVSMDHNLETWRTAKAASPNTLVIGRHYVDERDQVFLDDPETRAEQFFAAMRPEAEKMRGLYDAWVGYNESVVLTPDDAIMLSRFYTRWGDLMRAAGFASCAYSFGAGAPELNLWPYLLDGMRSCDLLALHEYSAPTLDVWSSWLCLRYRRVTDLLPEDARRPIVITETGIDGGVGPANRPQEGWAMFTDAAGYVDTLNWYDNELLCDDYVLGAAIFAMNGWGLHGSFGIYRETLIRDYIAQEGSPDPMVIRPAPVDSPLPLPSDEPAPHRPSLPMQEEHPADSPLDGQARWEPIASSELPVDAGEEESEFQAPLPADVTAQGSAPQKFSQPSLTDMAAFSLPDESVTQSVLEPGPPDAVAPLDERPAAAPPESLALQEARAVDEQQPRQIIEATKPPAAAPPESLALQEPPAVDAHEPRQAMESTIPPAAVPPESLVFQDPPAVDAQPARQGTKATKPPPSVPPRNLAPPEPLDLSPAIYVVLPGDSLADVARKFGVKVNTIVEANPTARSGRIRPGQALIIPRKK